MIKYNGQPATLEIGNGFAGAAAEIIYVTHHGRLEAERRYILISDAS